MQFDVQRIVAQVDGFARSQIAEADVATGQLQAVDAQGKDLARLLGSGFGTGRQLKQTGEVERALRVEFGLHRGFVQLDVGQVQGACPQAVPGEVEIQPFERDLARVGLADAQVEGGQFEREGVQLETLQRCRLGGISRQLLVGDALGDTRQDEEAEQAVTDQDAHHDRERALHSVGHVRGYSVRLDALEYGMPAGFLLRSSAVIDARA